MPIPHPNRLIGKAQLLNESGEIVREINCNHHQAYYQAIFDAMEKAVAKNSDYADGAVSQVRRYGGVPEHPNGSELWKSPDMPAPGQIDQWGGCTMVVDQHWWEHRARKRTRL